jgi:hypothetical protein
MILSDNQERLLKNLSNLLQVARSDLFNLINFESRWNPLAKNPLSGARGLLQFTNSTAKKMGFLNADDLVSKYSTIDSQLEYPVYNYLKQFQPFSGKQSLYMAVFYPLYRNASPFTVFDEYIQKLNPGIKTVRDYINMVDGKKIFPGNNFLVLILSSAMVYYYIVCRRNKIFKGN